MKKLLMCVIGTTMLTSVAVAEICTDFDDDFNLIEYECGTSAKDGAIIKTTKRERGKNIIDGNPLYMPKDGSGYSMTTLGYGKYKTVEHETLFSKMSMYGIDQEFGFGVTNRFTIFGGVDAGAAEANEQNSVYPYNIDYDAKLVDLFVGGVYRLINGNSWKLDALGQYRANHAYVKSSELGIDGFFDEDYTDYVWTFGLRGGYTTSVFTLAGHVLGDYENTESFNWFEVPDKQGIHDIKVGLDGQLVLNRYVNVVAGIEYNKGLDKRYHGNKHTEVKNPDIWIGMLGLNFNVTENTFVGLYAQGILNTPIEQKVTYTLYVPYTEYIETTKKNFEAGLKIGVSF